MDGGVSLYVNVGTDCQNSEPVKQKQWKKHQQINSGNVVIPVAGSVIAVHIVIGVYIWMAMKETSDTYVEPFKED